MLLYNMSSMLASVAAGYDVRLSNVSPIHPRLHPPLHPPPPPSASRSGGGGASPPPPAGRLYPHNTYHGHTPHYRTPLIPADIIKPLRFTDSPQHALSVRYRIVHSSFLFPPFRSFLACFSPHSGFDLVFTSETLVPTNSLKEADSPLSMPKTAEESVKKYLLAKVMPRNSSTC